MHSTSPPTLCTVSAHAFRRSVPPLLRTPSSPCTVYEAWNRYLGISASSSRGSGAQPPTLEGRTQGRSRIWLRTPPVTFTRAAGYWSVDRERRHSRPRPANRSQGSGMLVPLRAALDEAPAPVNLFLRDDDAGWEDERL